MAGHQRPGLGAPAETPARVLLHPTADERLAVEQWLLSTLSESGRAQARTEWKTLGAALLPLGTQFSAVRIPGRLVAVVAGVDVPRDDPHAIDAFLAEAFQGGPVICDPYNGYRYYVLVPASVPQTWAEAAEDWRSMDTEVLGRGWRMGVPRVDAVGYPEDGALLSSYWSVPMPSLGVLCAPLKVARLIAEARHQLGGEADL
ncbi:hypothetical protein [Streptomyces sp. NPDC006997]|uniref:hypothetical protein n=1 Tax=Streptomyces sp. NPDC006997 TaxID=3155356 RepID=UPI0033D36CF1